MTESYRVRSPETWDAARAAYLSGSTAEEACARFDLGLSAFRKRSREEGWRRADQPDPEPLDDDLIDDIDDDLPEMDDQALADLAFRRMSVEARRGRLNQALAWGRLRDMALRQIGTRAQIQTRVDRAVRNDNIGTLREIGETIRTIERTARSAHVVAARDEKVHEVHEVHPVSRAERRRLAAIRRKTGPP